MLTILLKSKRGFVLSIELILNVLSLIICARSIALLNNICKSAYINSARLPRVYKFNGPIQLESHLGVNRFYNNLYDDLYDVEKIPEKGKFGRVNAIAYDPEKNKWIGVSDPDWEGSVSNYEK